jgi:chondroitin 4-sulfotransferase 11
MNAKASVKSVVRRLGTFAGQLRATYMYDFVFVHINKNGGRSIEAALRLPFQHLTALELRQQLGARRWEQRFSFAFVRNPWDRVASHYHYRVQTNQTGLRANPIPFGEWVVRAYGERDPLYYDKPQMFMPQVNWLSDEQGTIIVDYIGRFERLREDFDEVCRRIGRSASLPHVNRSANRDYRGLYTPETADIVARSFAPDIALFGYTFDGTP